jgi:hypothetical protein
MTYTQTNWQDGDIITAAKLNNIEQGLVNNEQAIEDATLQFDDPNNDGNIVLSYIQRSNL